MSDEAAEKAKVCYQQNFLQARSLNEQMNGVPRLSMILTGGLWFGAGLEESVDPQVEFALLILAGIVNLGFILVVYRIRDVMQDYFKQIKEYAPEHYVRGRSRTLALGSYSMISVYAVMMFMAASISLAWAFLGAWPFPRLCPAYGVLLLILLMVVGWCFLTKLLERMNPDE